MSLPPFVRSPAFLSGLGAVGSGAVSIGGWQIYEESYPTANKQLTRKNLLFKPAPPALDADTSDTKYGNKTGDKYHLQTYECFKRFFPGVGVEVKHSASEGGSTFNDTLKSESNKAIDSGNPIGCALMNLSYEGVSDGTKHTKYVFKSEITVKNDTFGWALWVGSKYMKTGSSSDTTDSNQKGSEYYLLFLEKKESGWSIIGGYLLIDLMGTNQSNSPELLHISTPDKEDWAKQIRNHKENTKKEYREYSGVWIASEDGNEVFQDIEFWYGNEDKDGDTKNRSDNAEILGRVDTDFSKGPANNSTGGYDKSSGGRWLNNPPSSTYQDVRETLAQFYKPFVGKRGIWKRSEEYCKSKSYSRGLNASQLEELESLCYSKKTS